MGEDLQTYIEQDNGKVADLALPRSQAYGVRLDRCAEHRAAIRNCLAKLLTILAELQRQAKRENQSYNEDNTPRLWILSPSASLTLLESIGAKIDPDWPEGVYFLPALYRTAIIAINQLPVTVLRIFNNYGPRAHYEGDAGEVIPRSIVNMLYGKNPIFNFEYISLHFLKS